MLMLLPLQIPLADDALKSMHFFEDTSNFNVTIFFMKNAYFDMHYIFNSLVVLSGSMTSVSHLIQDLLNSAHHNFDLSF